jgi:hypothetical protein
VKNYPNKQKDLFLNLTEKGIFQLMNGIKNKNIGQALFNIEIRKSSFKILIEILYNNEILQNIFCEKFNLNPIGNIICLNWFPSTLSELVNIDPSRMTII